MCGGTAHAGGHEDANAGVRSGLVHTPRQNGHGDPGGYRARVVETDDHDVALPPGEFFECWRGVGRVKRAFEFSIFYIQGPSPVSLFRDEVSSRAKYPFSVCVESDEAIYMMVPRVTFWDYVNEDPRLLKYVKD